MNLKSELKSLVDELDQAHKGASPVVGENAFRIL